MQNRVDNQPPDGPLRDALSTFSFSADRLARPKPGSSDPKMPLEDGIARDQPQTRPALSGSPKNRYYPPVCGSSSGIRVTLPHRQREHFVATLLGSPCLIYWPVCSIE
jgi:hypothetical protein